jgi:hypothetical protein
VKAQQGAAPDGHRPSAKEDADATSRCPRVSARSLAGRPSKVKTMNKRQKAAVWLFAATSILLFLAALIPVVKGKGPNGMCLGAGTVFLVIAIASARSLGGRDS